MSVETSLKVSGFRFEPELGTRNHEPIEGKIHEQTFRIRFGFSWSVNTAQHEFRLSFGNDVVFRAALRPVSQTASTGVMTSPTV